MRDFFCDNALYWINEYRFDGLRFDAVHAIDNHEWLRELSDHIRAKVRHGRHVHLVLENEHNTANLLETHFDAQWNDDAHNTLHVLLTGETEGYYHAFADQPIRKLARVLAEGFAYQGEPSPIHDGKPRGEPSGHVPPTSFVMFLQNHDQIGNRAFGERLRKLCLADALRAATGLLLLSPQIPLLFMDEEFGSDQPFLFFTDYTGDLADAVREGRRREFARFASFSDEKRRAQIPDPNASTDVCCVIAASRFRRATRRARKARLDALLQIRADGAGEADHAAPRAFESARRNRAIRRRTAAMPTRSSHAGGSTMARRLSIALNLDTEDVPFPETDTPKGKVIFETPPRVRDHLDATSACRPTHSSRG